MSKQTNTMKTLESTKVTRIDKETGNESRILVFEASQTIAKYFGSERIGDACNIMNEMLQGKIFETDFAIYKYK